MFKPIRTRQTTLRPFTMTDVEGIFLLDSDPEVHRYLGNNPISTKEQAEETVLKVLEHYRQNGTGRLAIKDNSTGEFIGWAGIKYETEVRDVPYYDLGYRLRKKYWKQGIGFEVALASLEFGFRELNLLEICAGANVDNKGSNRILQKCGLSLREQFMFDGDLINWYGMLRSEWAEETI